MLLSLGHFLSALLALSNIDSVLWRGTAPSQWCGRFLLRWITLLVCKMHIFLFFYFFFIFKKLCPLSSCCCIPPPPLLCLISYDWHCSVLFTMHHSVSVAASLTVCFCSAAGLKRMALQLRSQRCLVSRTERVMIGVPVLNKQESAVRDELQLY